MAVSDVLRDRVRIAWLAGRPLPGGWSYSAFGAALEQVSRLVEVEDDKLYRQPVIRRGHGGIELRDTQLGRDILTKKQFQLHAGDWLMSKVQIMHRAYGIVPPELNGSIASGSYFSFRPRSCLDLKFFWYLSQAPTFHATCDLSSVGVVIEKMVFRVDDWRDFEFPLPPLSEQRKIAAILSSVDDAIEATRAVIDQLQVVKKAMMAELLTRGLPGRHTRFKQTEIGEVPEEWEVRPLGELALFITSGSRGWARYYAADGALFVRSQNIRAGFLDLTDRAFVRPPEGAEGERTKLLPDDVLVTITGNGVGNVGVGPPGLGDAYVSQHVGLIRLTNPSLAGFVAEFLAPGAPGNTQVLAAQYGQSKPGLSLGNLRAFLVAVPREPERAQILSALRATQARIEAEAECVSALRASKSALMVVLLNGEVRVSPDEVAA